jgi:hypothetical protein
MLESATSTVLGRGGGGVLAVSVTSQSRHATCHPRAGRRVPSGAGRSRLDAGTVVASTAAMRWCLTALLLCGLLRAPAWCADDEIRQCFEEGSKHYHLGEFADAAKTYKRCYKVRPDAIFLYNIAQCYRLSGDLQNALFFYRSYLNSSPGADNHREVEERIRKLEGELASQKAPPNVPVPPPTAGTSTAATPVTVAPASATVAAPETRRAQPTYKKWWVWTTVSLAAAGIGLGVGLGLGLGLPGEPQTRLGTQPVF